MRSNNRVIKAEVKRRAFTDVVIERSVEGTLNLHSLRWLEHVLHVCLDRMANKALFVTNGLRWAHRGGSQPITGGFSHIGLSRLSDRRLNDLNMVKSSD